MQERLSFLTLQQAEAEARVAVAQSEREAAQSASVEDFPQRYANAEIATLNTRLFELEQELTGLRSRFGENWPAVVEARNELELVEAQAAREKAAILASHREQAELDLQAAQARRRTAQLAMDQEKEVIGEFRDASIQYNILRREVDTNRNLYEGVLERLRQTGVMAGVEFGNTHVVESARPTRRPESPNVVLNLGAASLLGLVLGLCLVVGMDFWDNSISSLEEVEALLPVASLGGVPWVKEAKMITAGPAAEQVEASSSLLELSTADAENGPVPFPSQESSLPFEVTESLRAICASILLARSDERPRVIVVTSASQAEGKTTISTRLGEAFADAGLKTLLVEADLRKPDLTEAFQLSAEGGLSLYLAGHLSRPAVQETETKNLHVMAGGPTPPNPAALFHSERLDTFLKTMVSEHEIVIVDTPPTLAMADARILGAKADGVVLVARAGKTPVTKIRRAAALLEDSGASVLGMVLNGWEPDGAEVSNYIYAAAAKRA